MLIVFEGIDGAGKSLQAELFARRVSRCGFSTRLVDKEVRPIKQLHGQLISSVNDFLPPLASFLLTLSDVAYVLERCLESSEGSGHIAISHRYYYSAIVDATVQGLELERVKPISR